MLAPTGKPISQPIKRYAVNTIVLSDIRGAFIDGIKDFGRRPILSAFFGFMYATLGVLFATGLIKLDQNWLVLPAAIGFPLIGPFLAAGLYEMSRRYSMDEKFTWRDILLIIFQQQRREFGWMAFVVLFIFLLWIFQARLLYLLFFQLYQFSNLSDLLEVLATPNGIFFLAVGSVLGGVLAIVLFSVTVIAMPLLLDQDVDVLRAMNLSIQSVLANPLTMLLWGALSGLLVLLALLPLFIGLIIILPILGHATWHLYKRVIGVVDAN